MQAVVADAPGPAENLALREVSVPEPGPGQARLHVAYCALNPLDVAARAGRVPFMKVPWPFVPGLEHTGRVDAVGAGVDQGLIGRRVISRQSFGGCAEFSLAPATSLIALPDDLDFRRGAVFRGCSRTAWFLLNLPPRLEASQSLVAHSAAGPVGLMLTQFAKQKGATVIGLVGGPAKEAFARPYGADHLIDYRDGGWPAEVKRLTGGRGADLVIDGNGGLQAIRNYDAVAVGGRVIYIGATAGAPPPEVSVSVLIGRSISLGSFSLPAVEAAGLAPEIPGIVDQIVAGDLRVPIGVEVSLGDVPALHARFERRELSGRALVLVGGEV